MADSEIDALVQQALGTKEGRPTFLVSLAVVQHDGRPSRRLVSAWMDLFRDGWPQPFPVPLVPGEGMAWRCVGPQAAAVSLALAGVGRTHLEAVAVQSPDDDTSLGPLLEVLEMTVPPGPVFPQTLHTTPATVAHLTGSWQEQADILVPPGGGATGGEE